jgi:hypothetical protein
MPKAVEEFCPWDKKCEEITKDGRVRRCKMYQQIKGQNPQTGELFDEWDCAFCWSNILTIEQTKYMNSNVAALESFRNEVVGGIKSVIALAASQKSAKLK